MVNHVCLNRIRTRSDNTICDLVACNYHCWI